METYPISGNNKIIIEEIPSYECQFIKYLLVRRVGRCALILIFSISLISTVICWLIIIHLVNHLGMLFIIMLPLALLLIFVWGLTISLTALSLIALCLDILLKNVFVKSKKYYYIEIERNRVFIMINDKKKKSKIIMPDTKIYYSENYFFIHGHKLDLAFDKSMIKEGTIEDLLVYGKKVKIEESLKKFKNNITL